MKLKEDWSFTHFIYYTTWFALIGLVLSFITFFGMSYLTGDSFFTNLPVIDPMTEVAPKNFVSEDNLRVGEEHNFLTPLRVHASFMVQNNYSGFSAQITKVHAVRILRMIILAGFLLLLSRIIKSIIQENPFEQKNSFRLYAMGGLLIFLSVVDVLHGYLIANALSTLPMKSSLHFSPIIEIDVLIFFGLILLLLGYVFKEGNRIYEEQKLTV
ncbi:MAG: DUF2975 domain-containing protein [Gracilimonas sp.]|nr:DUF2975 domain-containing protein [Gracilimonas sp.]